MAGGPRPWLCFYITGEQVVEAPLPGISKAESRLVAACWGRGCGGWGVTADAYGGAFWSDENVLKLNVVMAAQFCECSKNH